MKAVLLVQLFSCCYAYQFITKFTTKNSGFRGELPVFSNVNNSFELQIQSLYNRGKIAKECNKYFDTLLQNMNGIVAWDIVRPNIGQSPCLNCQWHNSKAQCCDSYNDGQCSCNVVWDRGRLNRDCMRSGGMLCEIDATVWGKYGQDRSTKYTSWGLTCMPKPADEKCSKADYNKILMALVDDCVAVNHDDCRAWERACVDEPIRCGFGLRCDVDAARYNATGAGSQLLPAPYLSYSSPWGGGFVVLCIAFLTHLLG